MQDGDEWTFTVRQFLDDVPSKTIQVNYDGFVDGKKTSRKRACLFCQCAEDPGHGCTRST